MTYTLKIPIRRILEGTKNPYSKLFFSISNTFMIDNFKKLCHRHSFYYYFFNVVIDTLKLKIKLSWGGGTEKSPPP